MRKQVLLEQFERRMVELGCPARKVRRKVEELADLHANLKRTALQAGLAEAEAEANADLELGDPIARAEDAAASLRAASWWGRHPIIGFIVLPLLALGPTFFAGLLLAMGVVLSRMTNAQLNTYFQSAKSMSEVRQLLQTLFAVQYLVLTLLAVPFCWMARRSGAGLKWATVTCVICACQGMFFHFNVSNRNTGLSYGWTPNLLGGLGPLLIAAAGYFYQWQRLNRLPPVPAHLQTTHSGASTLSQLLTTPIGRRRPVAAAVVARPPMLKGGWFKKALRTPTYWVIAILLIIILPLILVSQIDSGKRRTARRKQAINAAKTAQAAQANPAPGRDQAAQDVKARQATRETTHEHTIDLRPYINAQLSETTDGQKNLPDNNLLELPTGTHVYGGIPFDVQGRIQLMGRGLDQWNRIFPAVVRNIRVESKCAKIYLFHSECCAQRNGNDANGKTVARLIVHYTDGTDAQIEIKSGVHLLDWWGVTTPTYGRLVTSPDSELAWIGQNPWIKKNQPAMFLRLFKSTFNNPQPELEIASVDYVSTMTDAAPFLVGLTVE